MATASSSSVPEGDPEHEPSSQEPQPSPPPPTTLPKKTPPLPWSHLETVHLIQAYQEKWYSLKRGQLKASQWEEVAQSVAARCGFDEPSKTATQCRHKMEKLRKRYRSEKERSSPSAWPYFNLMDLMERGPLPISARPIPLTEQRNSDSSDEEDDEDNDETNKSRSINYILRRPPTGSQTDKTSLPRKWNGSSSGGGLGVSRFLRNPMFRKRRMSFDIDEDGGEPLSELASVVRAFGEGFVRIENMKMEMMRETERYRMEMETKRTEMILESQRRIVDAIAKALGSQKKSRKNQET
ncbi:PREDICTED: uncharacterized protein LOC104608663 [Nelumbo nucifera]|uniref:Uncharacterized protein LOC104608663 n=2 Tax=Nelumbo nucifera TaxID=4432 RepID=A0A1U8B9H5_NELNU|nr:PREDICTED: uncharacterized protein LOC104608663 [Nelumbo nucifera]DAD21995.1 TPA_asm: hypothetical protein HUJ06_023458 [Nelumbo nucifera]